MKKEEDLIELNNPNSSIEFFNKGNSLKATGDNKYAIECYNQALKINPIQDAIFNKGNALRAIRENKNAIECYNQVLKIDPNFQLAYNNKGLALQAIGDNKGAIECYNQVLKIDPNYRLAYNNKGIALYAMRDNTNAIECYNQALKIHPNYKEAYYNKGLALQTIGDNTNAIECYNQALKIDPNYKDAYYNKGNVLQAIRDNKGAIECYNQVLKIDQNYKLAYNNKGIALYAMKDNTNAIECYNQAIQLDPNYKDAYNNKGLALKAIEDNTNAIECYNQAIQLDPNYKDAYNNKGNALKAIGDNKSAIECYNQTLKIDPDYLLAYCNRSQAFKNLQQNESALNDLKSALKLFKDNKVCGLSQANIIFFKKTIEQITQLEELVGQVEKDIEELNQNDEFTKKVKAEFKKIQKKKNAKLSKLNETQNQNSEIKEDAAQQASEILQKLQEEILELRSSFLKIEKRIDHHQVILEKGGVIDEARIKEEFENFEKEDTNLGLYFKTFYWTMSNYLQAYRVMNTNIVATDSNLNVSSAEKGIGVFGKVGKALPVIDSVIGAIDSAIHTVFEIVRDHKFQNNKNAINKVIMSKLTSEKEISTQINLAAIDIINFKKKQILFPSSEETSKIDKICNLISGKIQEIKSKLIEKSVITFEQRSKACEVAIQDVTFLLAYMYKHSDEIVNKKEALSQQLIFIIKYDQVEILFPNQENKTLETQPTRPKQSSCCTVFVMNRIEYANRLLNYPDTFWSLTNVLGIREAITLGESMMKEEHLDDKKK